MRSRSVKRANRPANPGCRKAKARRKLQGRGGRPAGDVQPGGVVSLFAQPEAERHVAEHSGDRCKCSRPAELKCRPERTAGGEVEEGAAVAVEPCQSSPQAAPDNGFRSASGDLRARSRYSRPSATSPSPHPDPVHDHLGLPDQLIREFLRSHLHSHLDLLRQFSCLCLGLSC